MKIIHWVLTRLIGLSFLLFFSSEVLLSANISSAQAGNWNEPSTWENNQIPQANDQVTIRHAINLQLDNAEDLQRLTIGEGGSLVIDNNRVLNVADLNVQADRSLSLQRGIINVSNNLTIGQGSIFNITDGNLSVNDTFDLSGSFILAEDGFINLTFSNDLIIRASANFLANGSANLNVAGRTIIFGTFQDNNNAGNHLFRQNLEIRPGGSFELNSNSACTFSESVINQGQFNKLGTGTVTFDSTNPHILSSNSLSPMLLNGNISLENNLDIQGSSAISLGGELDLGSTTVSNNNTAILTVGGNLLGTGAWINSTNTILRYQGADLPLPNGNLNIAQPNSTMIYAREGDQNMKPMDYAHLIVEGSGNKTFNINSQSLLMNEDLEIRENANLTISIAEPHDLIFNQNLINAGTLQTTGAGDVIFQGNAAQIRNTASLTFQSDIQVNNLLEIESTRNVTMNGLLSGSGTWRHLNGFALFYTHPEPPLVQGNFEVAIEGSIVVYSGTNQSIRATDYYNIQCSGTGLKTLTGNTSILGDIFIEEQAHLDLDASQSYTLDIMGSFINIGQFTTHDDLVNLSGDFNNQGQFIANQGNFILNGAIIQTVSTANETLNFQNLVINNPQGVNLEGSVQINNRLALELGIVNVSEDNPLVLGQSIQADPGNAQSYVNGPVSKILQSNESFFFPIGGDQNYGPLEILNVENNSTFTARYVSEPHPQSNQDGPELAFISEAEYWFLTAEPLSSARVRLYWSDATFSGVLNIDDLKIARWDSSGQSWVNEGGVPNNRGIIQTGALSTPQALSRFGAFSFASFAGFNPIGNTDEQPRAPILQGANVLNNQVVLDWQDVSTIEIGYLIERSEGDSENFQVLDSVMSPNITTYTDTTAQLGNLYFYRVLARGIVKNSEPSNILGVKDLVVNSLDNPLLRDNLAIYPSPFQKELTLELKSERVQTLSWELFNISGQKLIQSQLQRQMDQNKYLLTFPDLKPGFYLLSVNWGDGAVIQTLIKK